MASKHGKLCIMWGSCALSASASCAAPCVPIMNAPPHRSVPSPTLPQGVGLTELPHELLDKSQLTRLDLMVNQLEVRRRMTRLR